ncbi:MAG: hypothetical protein HC905_19650 [Bacteroidales bacterium]|nr:hypothetical protein [Bacteroidales bacterium]
MERYFIAFGIGVTAAILDVVPMIIQKTDKRACWSAFVHWLVLGMIIPFVQWEIQAWLKGLIIGIIASIPVMIIVAGKDKKSLIPISIFSAVLGTLVGIAGEWLIPLEL